MSKSQGVISTVDVLRGEPITWPKPDGHFDILRYIQEVGASVIFEDSHVIAFEVDDDEREHAIEPAERRITIAPKKRLASLLDLGVAEVQLSAHLLFALQQVAFQLNLQQTGFEVRCNVLPPYQRRPHLSLQVRTGDPGKSKLVS